MKIYFAVFADVIDLTGCNDHYNLIINTDSIESIMYHVRNDHVVLTTKSGQKYNIGKKEDLQHFWEKISQPFCISPGQILMTPEE